MPPRKFDRPTKYRLRVSYKVMIGDVPVESKLGAEIVSEKDADADKALIQAAMDGILAIVQQSGGTDVLAIVVTVDQHGNTRQESYQASG